MLGGGEQIESQGDVLFFIERSFKIDSNRVRMPRCGREVQEKKKFPRSWKIWKSHRILKSNFPGLEKSRNEVKSSKVLEKSWNLILLFVMKLKVVDGYGNYITGP